MPETSAYISALIILLLFSMMHDLHCSPYRNVNYAYVYYIGFYFLLF